MTGKNMQLNLLLFLEIFKITVLITYDIFFIFFKRLDFMLDHFTVVDLHGFLLAQHCSS